MRPANSIICDVAGSSPPTQRISFTHLIQAQPYQPGTTRRTGAPWSGVIAAPFMRVARKAPVEVMAARGSIQLAPGCDRSDAREVSSMPEMSTPVASAGGGSAASTSASGTPSHSTALIRPKFCGLLLPAHSMRWAPCGRAFAASAAAVTEDAGAVASRRSAICQRAGSWSSPGGTAVRTNMSRAEVTMRPGARVVRSVKSRASRPDPPSIWPSGVSTAPGP